MRFLFTTFEGGGHVPPALKVARVLRSRGHDVLVVSDEANRPQAAAAGLDFQPWTTAPNRQALGDRDDPLRDWRAHWPPAVVRAVCDGVIAGPAAAYAADTLAAIEWFRPDVLVSNELLFGAMAAAERASVPLALLTSNVWCFPTRQDLPPFGPGFRPASTAFEARREAMSRKMIAGWYDAGLADLNRARAGLGLGPLAHTLDQLGFARLVLLGTSRAFDYNADPPAPFVYAGPLGETPQWARDAGAVPDLIDPGRPNVLISFSTTHQGQGKTILRTIKALGDMPVRAIVTLGPALRTSGATMPPNVRIVAHADHDALVPRCRLVICHGGHGTVVRPLMHGVPVVVIPTGRDQPENAARIVEAGAGLRLGRHASAGAIRRAAFRALVDPSFTVRAEELGRAIAAEADGGETAAARLEGMVSAAGSTDARPAAER